MPLVLMQESRTSVVQVEAARYAEFKAMTLDRVWNRKHGLGKGTRLFHRCQP